MPVLQPHKIIIKGKRFATMQDLEDNVTTMEKIAEELIDLANFEMTCHDKVLAFVGKPTVRTEHDMGRDGIWTKILVVIAVDKEGDGHAEIVEL